LVNYLNNFIIKIFFRKDINLKIIMGVKDNRFHPLQLFHFILELVYICP